MNKVHSVTWAALLLAGSFATHVAAACNPEGVAVEVLDAKRTDLPDREGVTPLVHARRRGFSAMAGMLEAARR